MRGEFGEFVEVIPAQQKTGTHWYRGTSDAVYQNIDVMHSHRPKHVLVLAGDHIYKMDYGPMIAYHVEKGADITVGVVEVPIVEAKEFGVLTVTEWNRVTRFVEKSPDARSHAGPTDVALASMGIYVFNPELLEKLLIEDAADEKSKHDFGKDIIPKGNRETAGLCVSFPGRQDASAVLLARCWNNRRVYEANLELVWVAPELNIYDEDWPIWTYQAQTPPAKFVLDEDGRRGVASIRSSPAAPSFRVPRCASRCCSPACASRAIARRTIRDPAGRAHRPGLSDSQRHHRRRLSDRRGHADWLRSGRRCQAISGHRERRRDGHLGHAFAWLKPARTRGLASLLLACMSWLAGCAALPKFESPKLSVVTLKMQGGDFFSQRLQVRMRVFNPNARELPISGSLTASRSMTPRSETAAPPRRSRCRRWARWSSTCSSRRTLPVLWASCCRGAIHRKSSRIAGRRRQPIQRLFCGAFPLMSAAASSFNNSANSFRYSLLCVSQEKSQRMAL
jgi:hypothetical protein